MTHRPRLRPPRRARGGARAAQVLELHASERALAAEPWLRDEPGLRVRVEPERALTELAGTSDHQGVVAVCEPYPVRGRVRARGAPECRCSSASTGSPTRTTSAPSAAAPREPARRASSLPAHRSARVTPAVCRASAGAVEHLRVAVVPNLARYLAGGERTGSSGCTVRPPRLRPRMWEADLTGGVALVFGAEGKGIRPLVRRACDARDRDPARRAASSR